MENVFVSSMWIVKAPGTYIVMSPFWVLNQTQPHQRPQKDHASHGKAASLLALPNTWANSLCNFWKAVHGTKNIAALLSLPNPPMKFHFSDLVSLCGTKSYPKLKFNFFLFCVSRKKIFFLEKNTHLKSVGLGQELFMEKTLMLALHFFSSFQ